METQSWRDVTLGELIEEVQNSGYDLLVSARFYITIAEALEAVGAGGSLLPDGYSVAARDYVYLVGTLVNTPVTEVTEEDLEEGEELGFEDDFESKEGDEDGEDDESDSDRDDKEPAEPKDEPGDQDA